MRRTGLVAGTLALAVLGALGPAACSDDDGGSEAELCALVGDGRAYASVFDDGFDPTDHDQALAQLHAATTDLGELRAVAPASLHGAIDDELHYLAALVEVLETTDADDPAAVVAGVNELDEEREAAEVAALELSRHQSEHCGAGGTTTSLPAG